MNGLVKRSFTLAGHRTSVALEPAFWSAIEELAHRRGISVSALVASLDSDRPPDSALASVLRVHALLAQRDSR